MKNGTLVKIGGYCRNYRVYVLQCTLKDIEGSKDIKALSSFESGRSSNIHHLLKYVESCENRQQKYHFLQGVINTIEGG